MRAIPCGNRHEMIPSAEVRTPEQRAAVTAIVESETFDFACNNPFDARYGSGLAYTGPFWFKYYATDGTLHSVRIGKRGAILSRVAA